MKYFFFCFTICVILYGCNQSHKNKEDEETQNLGIIDKIESQSTQMNEIDYNSTEEFKGEDGLYSISVPKGLFTNTIKNEYYSIQLNAKIIFHLYNTHYLDQGDDENAIYSKNDVIKKYKNKLKVTYALDKKDWFVLSGINTKNEIVYVKGYYDEMISMQGREEGAPNWLWSKSGVLEIYYDEEHKKEFDKLIPYIMKSFKCNLAEA